MRELWLEMWHDIRSDAKSKFVTKGGPFPPFFQPFFANSLCRFFINFVSILTAKRGPLRDGDCYWDYGKARCAWADYCEYRYVFGDVHLGQSCRLRNSSADLLQDYL
ncbi:hypothetical protein Dimus_032279 [Dionaea muscipula]